jgi:hypothetical protein
MQRLPWLEVGNTDRRRVYGDRRAVFSRCVFATPRLPAKLVSFARHSFDNAAARLLILAFLYH